MLKRKEKNSILLRTKEKACDFIIFFAALNLALLLAYSHTLLFTFAERTWFKIHQRAVGLSVSTFQDPRYSHCTVITLARMYRNLIVSITRCAAEFFDILPHRYNISRHSVHSSIPQIHFPQIPLPVSL